MVCEQCGDKTLPETVIDVRREFGISRASRAQGGYCARCKIGMLISGQTTELPPQAVLGSLRQMFGLTGRAPGRACA